MKKNSYRKGSGPPSGTTGETKAPPQENPKPASATQKMPMSSRRSKIPAREPPVTAIDNKSGTEVRQATTGVPIRTRPFLPRQSKVVRPEPDKVCSSSGEQNPRILSGGSSDEIPGIARARTTTIKTDVKLAENNPVKSIRGGGKVMVTRGRNSIALQSGHLDQFTSRSPPQSAAASREVVSNSISSEMQPLVLEYLEYSLSGLKISDSEHGIDSETEPSLVSSTSHISLIQTSTSGDNVMKSEKSEDIVPISEENPPAQEVSAPAPEENFPVRMATRMTSRPDVEPVDIFQKCADAMFTHMKNYRLSQTIKSESGFDKKEFLDDPLEECRAYESDPCQVFEFGTVKTSQYDYYETETPAVPDHEKEKNGSGHSAGSDITLGITASSSIVKSKDSDPGLKLKPHNYSTMAIARRELRATAICRDSLGPKISLSKTPIAPETRSSAVFERFMRPRPTLSKYLNTSVSSPETSASTISKETVAVEPKSNVCSTGSTRPLKPETNTSAFFKDILGPKSEPEGRSTRSTRPLEPETGIPTISEPSLGPKMSSLLQEMSTWKAEVDFCPSTVLEYLQLTKDDADSCGDTAGEDIQTFRQITKRVPPEIKERLRNPQFPELDFNTYPDDHPIIGILQNKIKESQNRVKENKNLGKLLTYGTIFAACIIIFVAIGLVVAVRQGFITLKKPAPEKPPSKWF